VFRDEDIAQVLLDGRWQFFPSVEEVLAELELLADKRRQQAEAERALLEKQDRAAARKEWDRYCANNGIPVGTDQLAWIMEQGLQKIKSMPSEKKAGE